MAVKIRLRRVGAKKQPAYRIVIADARSPRDGRFIEIIGHYNPLTEPSEVVVNNERALYWLRSGAQPTEVVQRMLVKTGVWSEYTGEPMPAPPLPPVKAEEAAVDAPAEEAAAEEAPAEEAPAEAAAEEVPAEESPAEEAPVAETVVEAAPVEETPLVEAAEGEPVEAEGETAETEEKA